MDLIQPNRVVLGDREARQLISAVREQQQDRQVGRGIGAHYRSRRPHVVFELESSSVNRAVSIGGTASIAAKATRSESGEQPDLPEAGGRGELASGDHQATG